ncbi:MAG: heme exporter protein CcmD [Burkholderiales bacterium]|nr:heme exporter protein CcmD [Burkholderiales bacterium]
MNWGSAAEFFAMGGYADYVWGAYGITVLVIVAELLSLARRKRTCLRRISRRVTLQESER